MRVVYWAECLPIGVLSACGCGFFGIDKAGFLRTTALYVTVAELGVPY